MTDQQTCPRRLDEVGPWPRGEGLDTWEVRPPNQPGEGILGAGLRCCSFCGSLHPDDFMTFVRQGYIVGPTDKSYKAYLAQPYTDEEKAERRRRWLEDGIGAAMDRAEAETYYDEQMVSVSRGRDVAKFYYQHLSDQQRSEFIELANDGTMQIGYPGHFYRPPFFARRREQ